MVKKRFIGRMQQNNYSKYFFVFLFLILLYLAYLIIQPFLTALIFGIILAYISYPLYSWINKITRRNYLSATITCLIIFIIVATPLVYLIKNMSSEANYLYIRAKQKIATESFFNLQCKYKESTACTIINRINGFLSQEDVKDQLSVLVRRITIYVQSSVGEFILALPRLFINLFVIITSIFYLLTNGEYIFDKIRKIIPLKSVHQDEIIKRFSDVIFAVIYGSIAVALIQGLIALIGFYVFEVSNPLLWAIATTVFAIVPFVGAWIIWVPISLLKILDGLADDNMNVVWKGIGLFIYGVVLISAVDNFVKPYIIGERAKIHSLVIILGVFGGLLVFGPVGFFIGPLILAILKTFVEIYEREKTPH